MQGSIAAIPFAFSTKGWIFRGVEDESYDLVPKMGRRDSRKNLDGSDAGEYETSTEEVVAYYPQHLTPRITAQRGLFTCHKVPDRPYRNESIIKWIVPSIICFDLKLAVNKCGINEASMFPDLDGVAKHVGWLHKWKLV